LLGGPLLPGAKVEDLERLTAGLGKDTYYYVAAPGRTTDLFRLHS
jgi:hypothetical protein